MDDYCQHILAGDEFLNPSIGTFLNDQVAEKAKELFLDKSLFSDISFRVEGQLVQAHRAMIRSRCPALFVLVERTAPGVELEIKDATHEIFMAFLEYVYTAHAPIQQVDPIALMSLSNRFGITRLITLCELHMSKVVERETENNIEKADIDIVGLLLQAQQANARQLAAFCLHFVSANYQPMSKRDDFKKLEGENLRYVEEHQWPPKSYLKELAAYEKATKGDPNADRCVCM